LEIWTNRGGAMLLLSETVSDNRGSMTQQQRGRGRPRKYGRATYRDGGESGYLQEFEDYEADPVRGIGVQEVWTIRQQQNIILAERARDRIEADEDAYESWIDPTMGYLDWPQTVLTELGRIEDDETFSKAAAYYHRTKHTSTAHQAAKSIRYHFRQDHEVGL
jgi:hypothetical protein